MLYGENFGLKKDIKKFISAEIKQKYENISIIQNEIKKLYQEVQSIKEKNVTKDNKFQKSMSLYDLKKINEKKAKYRDQISENVKLHAETSQIKLICKEICF